eukprot:17131-Heterococcus_DN1.PRE.2
MALPLYLVGLSVAACLLHFTAAHMRMQAVVLLAVYKSDTLEHTPQNTSSTLASRAAVCRNDNTPAIIQPLTLQHSMHIHIYIVV